MQLPTQHRMLRRGYQQARHNLEVFYFPPLPKRKNNPTSSFIL